MTVTDKKTHILIADDHSIFRGSLKALLETEASFRVVGESRNGKDTLDQLDRLKPDLLLLDLSMPTSRGLDVLHSLSQSGNTVQTIILSSGIEPDQIAEAFDLGIRGLVMKDASPQILVESILTVLSGKYWIVGKSAKTPYRAGKKRAKSPRSSGDPQKYNLTPREMEVIAAVTKGLKTKEIARKLSISEQTVKHHITRIFDKLGVFNRLELTLFAIHHKLIDS